MVEKQHPVKSIGPYVFNQQERTFPRKDKQANSKWITVEILELIQERQKMTIGRSPEHRVQDKRFKKKCRETKENG